MKIIKLTAENVKRLTAVTITPDGHMTVIGGPNGAGKSSVLDAIMYALDGKKSLPAEPLRKGTKNGKVVLHLDGDESLQLSPLVVTRTFTEHGGGTLEIVTDDGFKAPSPQAILDDLCGRIAFDPLEFTRLKPKDQADMLRELVGLDFAELDRRRSVLYADRTVANRERKSFDHQAAAVPFHTDVPKGEVSVSELVSEMTRRQTVNEENTCALDILTDAQDSVRTAANDVARLRRDVAETQAALEDTVAAHAEAEKKETAQAAIVAKLVDCDIHEVQKQIASAEETNRQVRDNCQKASLTKQAIDKQLESHGLTKTIDNIDADKAAQLTEAKWPVEGLGFDDTGVTLNGFSFSEASSAEQLRVSVAMGFAMNPTLRTMLVRDGSLLDADSLALVAQLAEDNDGQVFVERVGDGAECSVVIEDGHVREEAAVA